MLYLLTIVPIKWIGFRSYDNSKPRDPAFYDDPLAPARWARIRTASRRFRSSPSPCCWRNFAARPQRLIDELAVLFLIVRIAYVFTYLGDRPRLRSILWNIGFAINIAIFFMPLLRRLWAA